MIKYLEKEKDFKDEIKDGNVLLDFYADWCGPCKMLGLSLEDLNEEREELKILKVNVDKFENIAREYSVMSIPTLIMYKNGKEINKEVGFLSTEDLKQFIDK